MPAERVSVISSSECWVGSYAQRNQISPLWARGGIWPQLILGVVSTQRIDLA